MHLAKVYNSLTNESWKRVWWLTLALKFLASFFIPFFSDEAYYWVWAKNFQLSYFDHPPMVSWLFYLGQYFDSFGTASRLPFVLISHLTIWIWCQSLASSMSSSAKLIFVLILALHPLVGLGGLVANPDVPFLFFWTLSALGLHWALERPKSKKHAFLLGAFLGLAFCSKYLIALILPPVFIFLILSKKWKEIPPQNIFTTTLAGFLFSLPVLIWNYQNDWASISFQMSHGLGQDQWKPKWTLEFILGTSILLFPPFLYIYFKNKIWREINFHNVTFISLFFFFIYTTFKGDTELNWPVMLYPSFFLLVLPFLKQNSKSYLSYLVVFGSLALLLIGGSAGLWGQKLHGRLVEGKKYEQLYSLSKNYTPLYLSTYQTASYFWYLSKTPYFKLAESSRPDFYDSLAGSWPQVDFFYFMKEKYQKIPQGFLSTHEFKKIQNLNSNFEVYEVRKIK